MPANVATTNYLSGTSTAFTDVNADARDQADAFMAALVALRNAIATRTGLLFTVDRNETEPTITALSYEANDKVKTLDRVAGDAQEYVRRLIAALADDEAMTARVQAAADALSP